MARVQHLPLYTAAYSYVREVYRVKEKLPKLLRYDLGQEGFASSFRILKQVVLANKALEKGSFISSLLLETEVQWAVLRLLYDFQGISEGEFKVLSERLSEIEKQAQAWLQWQNRGSIKKSSSRATTKNVENSLNQV